MNRERSAMKTIINNSAGFHPFFSRILLLRSSVALELLSAPTDDHLQRSFLEHHPHLSFLVIPHSRSLLGSTTAPEELRHRGAVIVLHHSRFAFEYRTELLSFLRSTW